VVDKEGVAEEVVLRQALEGIVFAPVVVKEQFIN